MSGHKSPTLFSGEPPSNHSFLEYYHNMYSVDVKRGDALLFNGSKPHGQGLISQQDTWTLFATLHTPGTFTDGFPNTTLTQSESIYHALTAKGKSWSRQDLDHFVQHPLLLKQVRFLSLSDSRYSLSHSFSGIQPHFASVGRVSARMMMHMCSKVSCRLTVQYFFAYERN